MTEINQQNIRPKSSTKFKFVPISLIRCHVGGPVHHCNPNYYCGHILRRSPAVSLTLERECTTNPAARQRKTSTTPALAVCAATRGQDYPVGPSQDSQLANDTRTNMATTSLTRLIAVFPSPMPWWGLGDAPAHARDPRSDSPLAGAGTNNLPAACRGVLHYEFYVPR